MLAERQIVQKVLHAATGLRAGLGDGIGELALGGKAGLA